MRFERRASRCAHLEQGQALQRGLQSRLDTVHGIHRCDVDRRGGQRLQLGALVNARRQRPAVIEQFEGQGQFAQAREVSGWEALSLGVCG